MKKALQQEITGPDTSRRKKLRPISRPRRLVDRALHCPAEHTTQRHSALQLHLHQPLQLTMDHQPVNHASSGTSSPVADRTSLHNTATLLSDCSQHCWGRPSDIQLVSVTEPQSKRQQLYDFETLINIVYVFTVVVCTNNPTVSHNPFLPMTTNGRTLYLKLGYVTVHHCRLLHSFLDMQGSFSLQISWITL